MIKRIIHVNFGPLTNVLADACYIPQCLNEGIEIEYLDVSSLFNFKPGPHSPKFQGYIKYYDNLKDLETYLLTNQSVETLINIQFYFEWRYVNFFKILPKLTISPLSTMVMGDLPLNTGVTKSRLKKLLSPKFVYNRVKEKLLYKLFLKFNVLALPSIFFCSGSRNPPFVFKKADLYPINYIDYDQALRSKSELNDPLLPNDFIVFLDSCITTHPDLAFLGVEFSTDEQETYKKEINAFFEYLEKKYNKKVVIAGHPKSNYDLSFFAGREVIVGKTRELVKHSSLVLAHHTTSASYAVIYNKPLMFLYSNILLNTGPNFPVTAYIKNYAAITGAACFNLSDKNVDINELGINSKKYLDFLKLYMIGPGLENQDSAKAFLSYLKKI